MKKEKEDNFEFGIKLLEAYEKAEAGEIAPFSEGIFYTDIFKEAFDNLDQDQVDELAEIINEVVDGYNELDEDSRDDVLAYKFPLGDKVAVLNYAIKPDKIILLSFDPDFE